MALMDDSVALLRGYSPRIAGTQPAAQRLIINRKETIA
jgi:hypothetical protein